ncbi:MAG: hypothetical protein AB1772_00620 [Candidatus Zixiibacteriota bacterium]
MTYQALLVMCLAFWFALSDRAAGQAWLHPDTAALIVRWNGFRAETVFDVFTGEVSFEGYNLYVSRTEYSGDEVLVGTFDIEDFCRYEWNSDYEDWIIREERFRIEDARCAYAPNSCNDLTWHPLDYSRQQPYIMPGYPDSVFYFEPIGHNQHVFGLETPFAQKYPHAPLPPYDSPLDVPADSVDYYLTADGYFKYWEYECRIEGLMSGATYWVEVTYYNYTDCEGWERGQGGIVGTLSGVPLGICCDGRVGDANLSGDDEPTIGDVTIMIDAKFISITCENLILCLAESDVNQSGGANPTCMDISIGDITILIDYLFITGPTLGLPECI